MSRRIAVWVCLVAVVFFSVPACLANAGEAVFAWMEGESPTRANIEVPTHPWGEPQRLSGQQWAGVSFSAKEVAKAIPEGGAILSYDFTVPQAGEYEVWGRVGMESVRAPFEWRVDGGVWREVGKSQPGDLSIDLYPLGRWKSIGWLKLADRRLDAGEHVLEIRLTVRPDEREGRKGPARLIFATDAFCVHLGPWTPNGPHKPGADWRSERDQAAAENVFRLPAASKPRVSTELSGLWQMARFDERGFVEEPESPVPYAQPERLHWQSMEVPGDRRRAREDLVFNHRYVLRTKVHVPADHAGRAFVLHFADVATFATVHINGKLAGHRTIPFAGWRLDVSEHVEPGQVNEIQVGIKDRYYALAEGGGRGNGDLRYSFFVPDDYLDRNHGLTMRYLHPCKGHGDNGILDRLTLTSTGAVHVTDVFAKPSVRDGRLGLQLRVRNGLGEARGVTIANEIVPAGGTKVAKRFDERKLRIPAGHEAMLDFSEAWDDPKLWWPDDPQLYDVVTTVRVDGKVLDVQRTRFGFRQWEIRGQRWYLNGVPQQLRADLTYYGADPGQAASAVKTWRENGQNMFRLRFQRSWSGMTQREVLEYMDAHGVPVRRTVSTFDGQHASYGLAKRIEVDGERKKVANAELLDNWRAQVRQRVIDQRNHPCIFTWELDNEIIYINTRNFGNLDVVEPEFTKAKELIHSLDSTRQGVQVAGGRALMDQSLPVNGCHYEETACRDYPDMAYGLGEWTKTTPKQPWPMARDRPIFLGETYFASGWTLGKLAGIGGEECFLGRGESKQAVARMARMFSEGYRWIGLGGFHYWFSSATSGGGHYTSWQPVAMLCRQWNWTFAGGATVGRTLKVFNDTRFDEPIDVAWELTIGGRRVAGASKTFGLDPGTSIEWEIEMEMPAVADRAEGELALRCSRGGREVFRDVKAVSVIDPDAAPVPEVSRGDVLVMDPKGAVAERLTKRGIAFGRVDSLDDARGDFKLLIVGPDALSAREATRPAWWSLAARGKRILVLDQAHPLHYQAVPADFEVTDHVGRTAFPENATHPVFAGLAGKDFLTWSGDHVVYRNVYRKASRGARSLVQCDRDLGCSALAECPVDDGLMLLCQLAVGTKLADDPVARRLFDQMVNYALSYRLEQRPTALVADAGSLKARMLGATSIRFDRVDSPGEALAGDHEILVVDATPGNLAQLAGRIDRVRRFCREGGWIMLWGVTPEGLADFNKLVGVEHLIRPFALEKVEIRVPRDRLMAGVSQRDVVMSTGKKIQAGSANEILADDAFSYVVDYRDVAPFAKFPSPAEMGKPAGNYGPGSDHWPRAMVNGLGREYNWRYTFTFIMQRGDKTEWTVELPREETIEAFAIKPNLNFKHLRKIKLTFDGDESSSVVVDVEPSWNPQRTEFEPRAARRVTFKLLQWDDNTDRELIAIDNLWLYAKRSDEFLRKVKPLLNIGALMRYPMGAGGIVLNQVNPLEAETLPINAQKKKTLVAGLLGNLGAASSSSRTLLPGEGLTYRPISLEGQCNLYLTSEKNWPVSDRDLADLPLDRQKLAGVVYNIRDFKTSPLESAIAVGRARGFKGPKAVEGIEVGGKADVLFFLHTWIEQRSWSPGRRNNVPPTVLEYVVHYADGESQRIPVRYGLGVADWLQGDPQGLRDAALAWTGPARGEGETKTRPSVWQMQWTNPRPDTAIESIDVTLDKETGNRYGLPVVLGITAANVIE